MDRTYQYNHWFSNTPKQDSHQAFTYVVWFTDISERYIGVKGIYKGEDWLKYTTSSKYVNELLKTNKAVFSIVEWFDSFDDAVEKEKNALTAYNVLTEKQYLNRNIGGNAYNSIKTKDTKGKNSSKFKGYWITPLGKFDSTTQAGIIHGCCPSVIQRRCFNDSKKFSDYSFEPVAKPVVIKSNKRKSIAHPVTIDGVYYHCLSAAQKALRLNQSILSTTYDTYSNTFTLEQYYTVRDTVRNSLKKPIVVLSAEEKEARRLVSKAKAHAAYHANKTYKMNFTYNNKQYKSKAAFIREVQQTYSLSSVAIDTRLRRDVPYDEWMTWVAPESLPKNVTDAERDAIRAKIHHIKPI
jgi:hypothetical protein